MSRLVDIDNEKFWDILFDEACVEGGQAERIAKELSKISEEYTNGSIDCENCLSTEYIQDKLQEQYRNGYADGWHDCASTIQQPIPYQPKGE